MEGYNIPLELFNCEPYVMQVDEAFIEEKRVVIEKALQEYGIDANIATVTVGPSVVTFQIAITGKGSPKRLMALRDELALRLRTAELRCYLNVEDCTVCLEVPNSKRSYGHLGTLLSEEEMQQAKPHELKIVMGQDMQNRTIVGDLSKMVHMLVAGSTASGKSIYLHSVVASLLYKHSPQELRLILIDPKQVEFTEYNGLPHLITGKAITDLREGIAALSWAVQEMERRYSLIEKMSKEGNSLVVNIDQYNQCVEEESERLPKIVIVVDELADLMLVSKRKVETEIQKLAQKSRAAGIHLIVSTQRASVDVITGFIKANFPTRVAFRVPTVIDSRVILDCAGAENLLGCGDYLYFYPWLNSYQRMQAPCVKISNIASLVEYIKSHYSYEDTTTFSCVKDVKLAEFRRSAGGKTKETVDEIDESYLEALKYVILTGTASISMIQRKCAMGYNKAGKIIEWMEDNGYISLYDGPRARKVFITMEEFEEKFGK